MKKQKRPTLNIEQRKRLIRVGFIILLTALLWLLFAPDMGVISLYRQKSNLHKLEMQKTALEKENASLRQDIDRIKNDVEYLERIAREKHDLLKKNEMIFDFSKEDKKTKK